MTARSRIRPFTGRHLFLILCCMFGVVATMNLILATMASKTFSGAVVANGYVANQDFNRWIERGKEQAAIGWNATAVVRDGELIVAAKDKNGASLSGAQVRVHLIHPFRAAEARWVDLMEISPGLYTARHDVARGQWDANIQMEKDGQVVLTRHRMAVAGSNAS